MADTAGLPSMPSTVDLAGGTGDVQGDPLEAMREAARQNIESVEHNVLPNENEKIEFKKYVLEKLKNNIDKFTELDKKVAEEKAKENTKEPKDGDEEKGSDEEDPFADIFDEEGEKPDETMQEKMQIAQKFIAGLKITKEKYLKQVRIKREKQQAKADEKNMEEILSKLDEV